MLSKLQRKTLIPLQIVGYAAGIFIGISIVLTAIQFYVDVNAILGNQTDIFKNNTAVISKNVSVFKTLSNSRVYFSKEESEEIRHQDFVENVAIFKNSTFEVVAYTTTGENLPGFQSDLFFESIPDAYLDVTTSDWQWQQGQDFIPIIIPEDYLNLYNFGFAESQGLPVFSKNAISSISFNIQLSGNGKTGKFRSRIVGFSGKINSILVPENFLEWANGEYGRQAASNPNRLLVEMNKPADETILTFFSERNYSLSKEKLEQGKIMFFFKTAFSFVFFIALIITALSISFIFLSFNFIFEKNKELIINLYNIGYSIKKIALFYQLVISSISTIAIVGSIILSTVIQNFYSEKFRVLIDTEAQTNFILLPGILILIGLIAIYNVFLPLSIRKIIRLGS